MKTAIELRAARLGSDAPREEFVTDLHRRLAGEMADGQPPVAHGRWAPRRREVVIGRSVAAASAAAGLVIGRNLLAPTVTQQGDAARPRANSTPTREPGGRSVRASTSPRWGACIRPWCLVNGFVHRSEAKLEAVSGVCTHQGCKLVAGRAREQAALPVSLDVVLSGRSHPHASAAHRAAAVAEVPGARNQRCDRGFRADEIRVVAYGVGMTDTPWEPPFAGTEARAPDRCARASARDVSMEDRRPGRRWADRAHRCVGVDSWRAAQALALSEDSMFTGKLPGSRSASRGSRCGMAPTTGSSLRPRTMRPNGSTRSGTTRWTAPRARVDAALARGGLDQLVDASSPDGEHASLRRLLCDLIEEYGRHTGHADLIREVVDGRVGEDPPPGWRPVSNR